MGDMALFLRVLGLGCLGLAPVIAGFKAAQDALENLSEVERAETALVSLRSQISYALNPLPVALREAGRAAGGKIGEFIGFMVGEIGTRGRLTPSEAFEKAAAACVGREIPRYVLEIFGEFFKDAGKAGHREELARIDLVLERLRFYKQKFREETGKRARLYRYLGISCGIVLVIVLL